MPDRPPAGRYLLSSQILKALNFGLARNQDGETFLALAVDALAIPGQALVVELYREAFAAAGALPRLQVRGLLVAAHLEAGRWEHVISDEVEERLVKLLENPTTCPHGNPIPGVGVPRIDLHALSESAPGDHVRLERVTEQVESDADSLIYLSEHGFVPGVDARSLPPWPVRAAQSAEPSGTFAHRLGTFIACAPRKASNLSAGIGRANK